MESVLLYGFFACYMLLLIQLLFLSRVSFPELFHGHKAMIRSINLIPFFSIKAYLASNALEVRSFAFGNLVGNIVMFVPLGIYLALFRKGAGLQGNLPLVFLVSLATELIQGFAAIGVSDVDDILLNCLGGSIGLFAYKLMRLAVKNEKTLRTVVTGLSVVVGMPVVFYFLFMLRLRL